MLVVGEDGTPQGIFTEHDAAGFDRFTQLHNVMSREIISLSDSMNAEQMFMELHDKRLSFAPVVDREGRLAGCVTRKGALRSTIYKPAVDKHGRLVIGAGALLVGVIGMLADKDALGFLEAIAPVVDSLVITSPRSPRAMPAEDLARLAADVLGADRVVVEPELPDAIDRAVGIAEERSEYGGAGVLVTGSVVLVGQARGLLLGDRA